MWTIALARTIYIQAIKLNRQIKCLYWYAVWVSQIEWALFDTNCSVVKDSPEQYNVLKSSFHLHSCDNMPRCKSII